MSSATVKSLSDAFRSGGRVAEDGMDRYRHPLAERYASAEMQAIFSPANRYGTWRRLSEGTGMVGKIAACNYRKETGVANSNPSPSTRFQPGQSGNPKGRPKGAHNKITQQAEDMLAKLTSGPEAFKSLEALRDEQPAVFWRIVTSLLPKQLDVDAQVDGSITVEIVQFSDMPAD